MTDQPQAKPGQIVWVDLTIPNAEEVRDFYSKLIGWQPSPVDMGGYNDFNMNLPGTDLPAAGVCHTRGPNADIPPQWMIYIAVTDLDQRIETCLELGGKVISGPTGDGLHRFCVIQDPAGAVAALVQVAGLE